MKKYYVHVYFSDGKIPIEIEVSTFAEAVEVVLQFDLPNVLVINIENYETPVENRTTLYVGSASK